ncbi:MAG: nuclear transport factor 2 family protein [Thermoleophilaceae bacterium]
MSAENIEIVRRAYEALASSDEGAALAIADPDVEIHSLFSGTEKVYRGHDGVREYLADMADVWASVAREPEQIRDAGDKVVVALNMSVEGRGSGVGLTDTFGNLWTLRDGKVVEARTFPTFEAALEAAGIEG